MIFGLGEDDGKNLCSEVENVFSAFGEKPRFEAEQIGVLDMVKCRAAKVNRGTEIQYLRC